MTLCTPDGGLDLSSEPEETRRQYATELLGKYVPSTTGDKFFAEIAKDYGGVGTTCGYLCHWLMWRMGCRDPKMVNRREPADGLHYVIGANISRIFANPHFVHYKAGLTPNPGDIVFVSNGTSLTEHVFVHMSIDESRDLPVWTGANAGQTDPKTNKQCAQIIDRQFTNGSLVRNGNSKKVVGWIDIGKLPLSALANLDEPA